MEIDCKKGVRESVVVGDERYYILLFDDKLDIKIPFENRAERQAERRKMDIIAAAVTRCLRHIRK
jgi:hypothetical protein